MYNWYIIFNKNSYNDVDVYVLPQKSIGAKGYAI